MKPLWITLILISTMTTSYASPIVFWGGDYVSGTTGFNLPTPVDSGNTRTWAYSDQNPLTPTSGYSAPAGQSEDFYGMLQSTSFDGASDFIAANFADNIDGDFFRLTQNNAIIEGMFFFVKEDFLNGFDAVTLSLTGLTGKIGVREVTADSAAIHFAVQHDGNWYLSESSTAASGSFEVADLGVGNWGAWDPTGAPFDSAPTTFDVAGSTLNDVEAVGFYFTAERGTQQVRLAFDEFEVIPEPGTLGLLAMGVLGVAALRRRLR